MSELEGEIWSVLSELENEHNW